MSKWYLAAKKADFYTIGKKYGIDPVIARIIRNRDVIEEDQIAQYLYGGMENCHSYTLLNEVDKAAEILSEKIAEQNKIRIIGDYDVDGICSACILLKGLSACGADVDVVIPDRIKDGYGINGELIRNAVADGIDTIITCDNGIAAGDVVAVAKQNHMTCIITDHHEVPFIMEGQNKKYFLPEADAVVDPKREDTGYPFPGICGAFVTYKLMEAMKDEFPEALQLRNEMIELAGFATVCDVMELRDENRVLVKTALRLMQQSNNIGLKALIQVNQLDAAKLTAYHLGFVLGPCMNATGRLDDAMIALELLQCTNMEDAIVKATSLKRLNESRRDMTEQGMLEAVHMVEQEHISEDKVLVVFLPELHESLAGIIAGRLREKYGKPTFVFTKGENELKGSARSIESYHIYEEMTKCSELFLKFGGHKMAAGFSMKEENLVLFREKINSLCTLKTEDYEKKIVIDAPMPLSYVTIDIMEQMKLLEPFGQGNEKPVFAQKNLYFMSGKRMGKNKDMARFDVMDENGRKYAMLLFRGLEQFLAYVNEKYGMGYGEELFSHLGEIEKKNKVILDVVYYPSVNEYRGQRNIEFIIQDYR